FLTRSIGDNGIGSYMLIMPTFNLFITLCTMSLPISISKVTSEGKRGKRVVLSLIPISIIYNLFLMLLLFILSPYIANNLLKNSDTYLAIKGIALTLPFISLSSILKGYFYGKERMIPYIISNIIEQIVRLLFIIYLIPKLIIYGIDKTILWVVLINIFSELSSIITLILFIPCKKININDFKLDKNILKDILNISLSATGSRFIGSISYFLEPIILTFILLKTGYTNTYITHEYGIITGYIFPLLLIPSFFTMAISTSLLPTISASLAKKRINYAKKKLKEAIYLSLLIGVTSTIIFILIPDILLKFIYNTNSGINYVRIIAPFFIMHHIQGPLTSYMQASNMANIAMLGTLKGAVIKNITLVILSLFLGIYGFIISSIINIFYVTIHHAYYIYKSFKSNICQSY
ncbi:MAG: oligosaccharide flippase family protein, partial [Bacilli bacterium]|nr:oligosaccharide flippase family protein [Bacilli bacterium]